MLRGYFLILDCLPKATLSSPRAIHDFFQAYLPKHLCAYIEIQSIVPTQPNHISPTLKELHNDFIFTCRIDNHIGFICLEHQSIPDWRMPVRFSEYNTYIIKQYLKGKRPRTLLPFILNMCLFHYKINEPYLYPTHLYDCCPNPYLARELGMFTKFHLINLSTTLDSSLESYGTVSLNGKLFKYSREKELFGVLGEELERCRKWILGKGMSAPPLGADYWESILCYASNGLNPAYHSEEDLVNLFKEKLFISKEEIMKTIARQML